MKTKFLDLIFNIFKWNIKADLDISTDLNILFRNITLCGHNIVITRDFLNLLIRLLKDIKKVKHILNYE
jgi:hypothetical protein